MTAPGLQLLGIVDHGDEVSGSKLRRRLIGGPFENLDCGIGKVGPKCRAFLRLSNKKSAATGLRQSWSYCCRTQPVSIRLHHRRGIACVQSTQICVVGR